MALFRRSKPMDPAEIEGMKAEITSLRATLDRQEARPVAPDTSPRIEELATKVANLDARVTSVSTELANQISELSTDIDSLDRRPNGNGVTPEVVGDLRDGQVRLANEQARYQIAFREDLARLAEQLRRP
jgi:capsule polysaccharide export protein KpsE/RkpR